MKKSNVFLLITLLVGLVFISFGCSEEKRNAKKDCKRSTRCSNQNQRIPASSWLVVKRFCFAANQKNLELRILKN